MKTLPIGSNVLTLDSRRGVIVPGRIAGMPSVCVEMRLPARSIVLHEESSLRIVAHASAMNGSTPRGNVALEAEGLAMHLRDNLSGLRGSRRQAVKDAIAYCQRVTDAACTDDDFDADAWRVWLEDSRSSALAAIGNY